MFVPTDAQVKTGYDYLDETQPARVPGGIVVAFWVLLGVQVGLYVIGWPVGEYLGRRRRSAESGPLIETKEAGGSGDRLVATRMP